MVTAPVRLPLLVDAFLQPPPPVPPVLSANFVSTGIAVFLAGHDSFVPAKRCNSTIDHERRLNCVQSGEAKKELTEPEQRNFDCVSFNPVIDSTRLNSTRLPRPAFINFAQLDRSRAAIVSLATPPFPFIPNAKLGEKVNFHSDPCTIPVIPLLKGNKSVYCRACGRCTIVTFCAGPEGNACKYYAISTGRAGRWGCRMYC